MKSSDLLQKSKLFSRLEPVMRSLQLAYLGGSLFREDVRQKRSSEDAAFHRDIIQNTSDLPVAKYIVDTINDLVFSQPVNREIEFADATGREVEIPEEDNWSELFCYDADLNNTSLDGVMENIGDMTSIFGHCWVAVDLPSMDQGNAGRPYVSVISPLHVWNWDWTIVRGRFTLQRVKIIERETENELFFKCYELGTTSTPSRWQSYVVKRDQPQDSNAQLLAEGTFPPGMSLPIFLAYTRKDPRTIDVGMSDITTASDTQREIYKIEAEAYSSILFSKTLIRADAGVRVPVAAGGIVRATEGQIETLTVDTNDVTAIIEKQEKLLAQLETLMGFGGLRQSRETAQSGIAIVQERKQLHKIAAAKARMMEVAEEMIWTYAARFMDVRWAGEIVYGTDYERDDVKYQTALMDTAQKLSAGNPVIQAIINEKVLDMLCDDPMKKQMYLQKMVEQDSNMLIVEEAEEKVETRDIGEQVPNVVQDLSKDEMTSPYTSIRDVGMTTYSPVADLLLQTSRAGI